MNFKWIIVALSMGALGGWACGSDDGGGKGSGSICDESSSSFDAEACFACGMKLTGCIWAGMCSTESDAAADCARTKCAAEDAAAEQCRDAAYDPCAAAHPDDFDAFDACVDAACASEGNALDACGRSKCSGEAEAIVACLKRDCPEASACISEF